MEKIMDLIGQNFPQFNTVSTTTTVRDALYKMYCEHVDYLIVLDSDVFCGLLTEHDVAGKVLFTEKPLHSTLVKEFMTVEVPAIAATDSLEYAMQLLEHYKARYLAVFEDFDFKGIVSAQDLMRHALKNRQTIFGGSDEQQKHAWSY